MLELIFQGFIEWIYSLVLECWEYCSTSLLDIMSLDLAYIKSHVPVVNDILEVMLAVGWALLLGNLVFQAMKGMASGLGFEAEDPKMLFGRTFVFAFLLVGSPQICEIGLNLTSSIMTLLQLPDAIDVHLVDASIFGNLLAAWLIVIVFDIIIMFKVLKLLLKIAEQYVVLSTLTVTAPLAFAMGGSRNTAPIFTGWCRMYGSMCLLMVTNVMFFKLLLSAMAAIPSGLDVIPWMVLISAIVKVARKADDIITRIGLNPAMTGNDRGRGVPGMLAHMVLQNAASQVIKAVGAAAGGVGHAAAAVGGTALRAGSPAFGFGRRGSGKGGGASGGQTGAACAAGTAGTSGGAGTAGAAGMSGAAGAAAAARPGGGHGGTFSQFSTQQGPSPQGGGTSGASTQSSVVQNGGDSISASAASTVSTHAASGGGSGTGSSRRSSVPAGARRSPGYVPTPVTGTNTAGIGGSPVIASSQSAASTLQESVVRSGGFGAGRGGNGGGAAGRGSAGSGQPGAAGTAAQPTAGGTPSRGKGFHSAAVYSGTVGIGSPGAGTHQPGAAEIYQTSVSEGGSSPTGSPRPGTAGMRQAPASGGRPSQAGVPQPGAAGTGVSSSASTSAMRSTRYQAGEKARKKLDSGAGKTVPVPSMRAKGPSGTPGGQGTPGRQAEARSTHRVHSERTAVERTEHTREQSGAAGTAPAGPVHPSVQPVQTGRGVPPAAVVPPSQRKSSGPVRQETRQTSVPGRSPDTAAAPSGPAGTPPTPSAASTKRQQSSPARQEHGKTTAVLAPPAAAPAPGIRPGPAGTAPDRSRQTGERQTARSPSREASKKADPSVTPPAKRPRTGTVPPASNPTSGPNRTDRSGHSGGTSHGG